MKALVGILLALEALVIGIAADGSALENGGGVVATAMLVVAWFAVLAMMQMTERRGRDAASLWFRWPGLITTLAWTVVGTIVAVLASHFTVSGSLVFVFHAVLGCGVGAVITVFEVAGAHADSSEH